MFALTSIPKCGTHFLRAFLANLGLKPCPMNADPIPAKHYRSAHLAFDPKAVGDLPVIFAIRDPRDYVVSLAHHIATRPEHKHHARFVATTDPQERYRTIIEGARWRDGQPKVLPMTRVWIDFSDWLWHPNTLVVRFEDFIGARGGGSDLRQADVAHAIARHCGLKGDYDAAIRNAFRTDIPLFRKGQIGQWREEFSPETQALFEQRAGYLVWLYDY